MNSLREGMTAQRRPQSGQPLLAVNKLKSGSKPPRQMFDALSSSG